MIDRIGFTKDGFVCVARGKSIRTYRVSKHWIRVAMKVASDMGFSQRSTRLGNIVMERGI